MEFQTLTTTTTTTFATVVMLATLSTITVAAAAADWKCCCLSGGRPYSLCTVSKTKCRREYKYMTIDFVWGENGHNASELKTSTSTAEEVPSFFTRDTGLREEDEISSCRHLAAPAASNLYAVPGIRWLALHNKGAQQLPENLLARARDLRIFRTRGGHLISLPENLFAQNPSLAAAYLTDNPLTSLPEGLFRHNLMLKEVDLSRNRLATLPSNLFASNALLEDVNLNGNALTSLPGEVFNRCPELTRVSLRDNKLNTVPAGLFAGNLQLLHVTLSNDSLTWLPEGLLTRIPDLECVDLTNNILTSVSSETFTRNQSNGTLRLEGNPVSCDCQFSSNVTGLSQNGWTVVLPQDCETKMNVHFCTKRVAYSSSNRMLTGYLYIGIVGWSITWLVMKDLLP